MIDLRRIRDDILALALLAATVFVGLSLVSYDPADAPSTLVWPSPENPHNLCGQMGATIAHHLHTYCGFGAWFALLCLLAADCRLFSREGVSGWVSRVIGASLALASVCVTLQLFLPNWRRGPLIGTGGAVGAWGVIILEAEFARVGTLILLGTVFLAGMLLTGDFKVFRNLGVMLLAPLTLLTRLNPFRRKKTGGEHNSSTEDWQADRIPVDDPDLPEIKVNTPVARTATASEPVPKLRDLQPPEPEPLPVSDDFDELDHSLPLNPLGEDVPAEEALLPPLEPPRDVRVNPPTGSRAEIASRPPAAPIAIQLPPVEILETAEDFPYELLANKARQAAKVLEQTFKDFGLNIQVVEIDTGPVITQFELALEAGLRVSKVTALADDLAVALRVPSVRVVASIPGKNTVGIEVPNEKQVMVRLRELLESNPEQREKLRVPIYMGKDVSGRPLVVDLTKMPHLLIAGRTGTGKSVCLNTLILSILMTRTPDEVKMLMIDPKMVELSPYKRVPHLMHPVITDMKKAEAVLAWAVDKMEERYDLLARSGVRHLDGYNQLGKTEILDRLGLDPGEPEDMLEAEAVPERMPYIIIIADEMADMMMTSGKDVEGHIIRLAQKSRAVGIHLVLATQKPTVDVITGLIKSNLPARVSFQVASRTDSRVVLDEMGAERLLGNGDMLYLAPGTSHVTRAQGAYVSDDEINEVIDFYSAYEPQYSQELAKLKAPPTTAAGGDIDGADERDELYQEAVDIVIREQLGSVSRLQRFLGIGYGRAARLVDYMAEDGIVGDYNGSKAREVLYTVEEWEALKNGREAVPA